jgi:hypothetical protein
MPSQHVSFVLLKEARDLDAARISASHRDLFSGSALATDMDNDFLTLRSSGHFTTYVASTRGPVPNGEADGFAEYSYGSILGAPRVEEHGAHVIVITRSSGDSMIDSLQTHLRHTASVAHALDALGIYDGNAGATHIAPFYIGAAQQETLPPHLVTGLSLAKESEICATVLTKGLRRLGLREFLITVPIEEMRSGVEYLLDLVGYVVNRQEQLGDGETVGRSPEERLLVRHQRSPVNPAEEVVTLDLRSLGHA